MISDVAWDQASKECSDAHAVKMFHEKTDLDLFPPAFAGAGFVGFKIGFTKRAKLYFSKGN